MSVLDKVTHYQRKIERNKENSEGLIDCINKLDKLPITVRHLEKTGIGKTINALRKIDGEVGNVAKALVWKWKRMVIAEAVAEERAERERRLRDPTVSSSDENFPNSDRAEEEEPTNVEEDTNSTLSSTTGNDGTAAAAGVLQETCEEECTSSTANQIVNVSKYESDHCDTLQPSTEGEDNIQVPIDSASHPPPLNQNSPKDRKEKDSHSYHHHHHKHYRHSSKHHSNSSSSTSRKDRPKEKKKSKHRDKAEAGRSESETRVDDFKVKIKTEKVDTDDEKEEQEEKTESSGSSSKHKQHSKRAESERKTSEKKYHHKEREQKRKSDHSARNPENIPKHSKSSEKAKKMKITIADDDSIDCFSGASFAEALGMGDTRKKKKSSSSTSAVGNTPSGGSPSSKITKKPSTSTRETAPTKPELLLADIKLEPLDVEVDLASTLPEISPNYKPLPHVPSPSKLRKGRPLTEEAAALNQAVTQVILSKQQRQRTKVYSGVKTGGPIPTLYDLCVHVLKENIDALEYTGGVPYDILKPILQQATPEQLFQLEHYNPYLIEDTDELWDFHCRKEFRTGQRLQMETAREMYLRCLDEREAKLKALTCNIQQSLAKSTPVRQTKLAYVDSVAKPPRNVARQQAKYGTGSIPKPIVGKPEKNVSVSKPSTSTSGATSCFSQRSTQSNARVKPRMAPLMQKTMKLAKSFKR